MPEYFDFEEAISQLEIGEEELKRMVSEGELRAFRNENKLKFKKEDIEGVKMARALKPERVFHHNDPPCTARLINGFCSECRYVPDTQSICFYFYCPGCKMRLEEMKCPTCKRVFKQE